MAAFRYHLKVLYSHPSDAKKYLPAIKEAFKKANDTFGELLSVQFNVYYWERDAYRCWGDAQLAIDDELVKTADIVVAVFESRLGTPVHGYESGTDEEIRTANTFGNKHIWVYFSESGHIAAVPHEKERLHQYKNDIGKLCFYSDFLDNNELNECLYQQISLYLNKHVNTLKSKVNAAFNNTVLSGSNPFIASGDMDIKGNQAENQQFIQTATFHGDNSFGNYSNRGDKQ